MGNEQLDPRHTDVVASVIAQVQQEEEFQETLHRLSHQGMDYAALGRLDEVERIFSDILARARARDLPRWEGQILFNTGVIFDRSGKAEVAKPYLEKTLAIFTEQGPLRMEVNVRIFLGNILWKTGAPEQALPILLAAVQQARVGCETKQIAPEEYETELFGIYRELGRTYQAMGRF